MQLITVLITTKYIINVRVILHGLINELIEYIEDMRKIILFTFSIRHKVLEKRLKIVLSVVVIEM